MKKGDKREAFAMSLEEKRYYKIEKDFISKFNRIFVCSENDYNIISTLCDPGQIYILPNTIRLPELSRNSSTNPLFIFLFVGSLNYYPNLDGIIHFCTQSLPIISTNKSKYFQVNIIGPGLRKKWRKKIQSYSEVKYLGHVEDLTSHYHNADVVIVPIRAGSGTRIKLLEAFSFKKPTVSTSIGAEGIKVLSETHLLIADSPQDFAHACLRLMNDKELGRFLGENAYSLAKEKYNKNILENRIKQL
jgi:glycosyltransferase involved in cell wall biosynthesis